MQKKLITPVGEIIYKIKMSSRAKHVRLTVLPGAEVILTVPVGVRLEVAENFLKRKINWLCSKLKFAKKFQGPILRKNTKREYKMLKQQALALAGERVLYWNRFYNYPVRKIFIKNQKTRWASASKKGNLNFNYKIVELPNELLDYLVVHELCHLKEFNHSKAFWALVAKTVPNFKDSRRRLRNIVK